MPTPSPISPIHRLMPAAIALGLLLVFGFGQSAFAQANPPLEFGDNFFVTGDYVVAGAQGMTSQIAGGFATGTIKIPDTNPGITGTKSVPPGAGVVAAFLYWQTVEKVGVQPGQPGSGQNGFFRPVFKGGPATGYAITGVDLNSQGTVSFSSGGCTGGSTGKLLRTYRAEVRAFLPQDAQGNVLVNTDGTGFNGYYEVRLPSTGNNTPLTLGATLVIIYRVLSPNVPLNSIVIYDGPYAPGNALLTMTQTVQGFYDADGIVSRLTHIVGGGKNNKFQTVSFGSGNNPNNITHLKSLYGTSLPAFPGYYGTWDNPTWTFPDPANPLIGNLNPMQAGAATATTEVVPSTSNAGCVTWGAVIVSTTVKNTDGDSNLDSWKTNQGYCDASINAGGNYAKKSDCIAAGSSWVDLTGATLGTLASPHPDVFVQLDYMCSNYNTVSESCDTPPTVMDSLSKASPGSGAINASGGYTTYTISGGGACFAVGTAITVAGFTNPANNGQFAVANCTGNQLVVNNAKGAAETPLNPATATFTSYSFDPRVLDPLTGVGSFDEVNTAYANKGITLHPEWHAMPETPGCTDTVVNGVPSYCPYLYQPGLVGWKGGFDALKGQPLNYPDESSCETQTPPGGRPGTGPVCMRRFQHGRKDSYHEVIFAHAQGGPEWSFQGGTLTTGPLCPVGTPCVAQSGQTVTFYTSTPHRLVQASGLNDQNPLARVTVSDALTHTMLSGTYLVQTTPTPTSFTIQITTATNSTYTPLTDPGLSVTSGRIHTRSGFSDVGGADSIVTLGLWDPTYAQQVTGTTLMHEFGHANGLTHGGFYYDKLTPANNDYRPTVEDNCKPNFQSVMSYPFQLGHLDNGTSLVVDYSEEQLDSIKEGSLPIGLTISSIAGSFYPKTQWYTSAKPSTGDLATTFCEGTPVPPGTMMYLVGGPAYPIGGTGVQLLLSPAWKAGDDINFEGASQPPDENPNGQMRGHSDWTTVVTNGVISPGIDLRQVGATGADAFGGGGSMGPGGGAQGPGGGAQGPGGGAQGPGGGAQGPGGGSQGPGGGAQGPGGGAQGPGGGVGEVDVLTATAITFAPSHLTATEAASARTITLKWTPAPGQIGAYNVYRSSDNGATFTIINAANTNPPHTVTGNPPATTYTDTVTCHPTGYQYYVTAVQSSSSPNAGKESGGSSPVSTGQNGESLTGCYLPPVFSLPGAGSSTLIGNVVTATWTVQAASNQNGVTFANNAGSNTLVAVGPISNDVGCALGPVPNGTPHSTIASAGTGITFNPANDQFTALWNTALGFAGGGAFPPGCYFLELDLDSGQPAVGGQPATAFQRQLFLSDMNESVVINTTSLFPDATAGMNYTQALQETGGVPLVTWMALVPGSGPLPGGIMLPASGTLSGIPTTAGKYPFTVQATDHIGDFGTQPLTLTVHIFVSDAPPNPPLPLTALKTLPNAVVGSAYNNTVYEFGGVSNGATPFTWTVVPGSVTPPPGGGPSLPGLSFQPNAVANPNGMLSGTSCAAGIYNFTAMVTDSNLNTGMQGLTLQIDKASTSTSVASDSIGNTSVFQQPVKFTVTVAQQPQSTCTPTGTVTLFDSFNGGNPTQIASSALSGGIGMATATFTTSALSVGMHSITASYSGDSNFNSSNSATLVQTVNKASTAITNILVSPAPAFVGQAITVAYNFSVVSPGAGAPTPPTGTVTVADTSGDNSGCVVTPAVLGLGMCTLSPAPSTAGPRTFTVTYSGDGNFFTSGANGNYTVYQLVFTVQPSNTGVGLTMTPAVQVTAEDASNTPFTSFTGGVTLAINSGPGTLSGTTTQSAVSGVATFNDLSINKVASADTLVASLSGGVAPAISSAFNITLALNYTQLSATSYTQPNATQPGPRCCVAMAYDPVSMSTLLFGGNQTFDNNSYAVQSDTWRLQTSQWTQLTNVGTPPPARSGAAMVFYPPTNQIVLFGGSDLHTTDFNDTWIWDGSTGTWTQVTTAGSPPGRRFDSQGMAYDPNSGNIVMFGGIAFNNTSYFNDTWVLQNVGGTWTWTQMAGTSPSARRTVLATDPSGNVMQFGGDDGTNALADTWVWDGTNWNQKSPAASPSARSLHNMAFNPNVGAVVLFAGGGGFSDVWSWDGTTWTQVTPAATAPQRFAFGMDFDGTANAIFVFGGFTTGGGAINDTWKFTVGP